jgi:Response regulators consisting of a CheY-like receiver domain and a winged-helix DNA-binding domain
MAYKILLIEDEQQIRKAIHNFLRREAYEVYACATGEEGILLYEQQHPDLILLDMMLPGICGEDVLLHIRQKSDVPIIIISALDDELIQQDAYMQSVDDYVIKPFSIKILMYKIAALLRRVYAEEQDTLVLHGVKIICNNYEVYYQNQAISITPKEFEILQVLMQNKGRVHTRDQLLHLVWGYDYYGDSRTIDVHIRNLRKKLPLEFIKTVKGIGYKVE